MAIAEDEKHAGYELKRDQGTSDRSRGVIYHVEEISREQAVRLRRHGLPRGVEILERDEVRFWGADYVRSEGGLYVPERLEPIPTQPVALDLFAGCGGFSLGVQMAGFDVVCAVEWSADAAFTYLHNLGRPDCRVRFSDPEAKRRWIKRLKRLRREDSSLAGRSWIGANNHDELRGGARGFWFGDVCKARGADLLELGGVSSYDLIIGGPPCQGMSRANSKASIHDPRNRLVHEYLRLVAEIRPRWFLMENVPQLFTIGGGSLWKEIATEAKRLGYAVNGKVLNAAEYGVPQNRHRAFVMGQLGGAMFPFPIAGEEKRTPRSNRTQEGSSEPESSSGELDLFTATGVT
ncbi:MAG TPA: DNA cytosine methyltransferase [Longimicrobiaceae bacterium]|jgi:site-specific DNA-cytosine methylase